MKKKTNTDDLYLVGVIIKTHGLRGEVKVYPTTDDISRFKGMKDIILDTGQELMHLDVEGVRPQKNLAILKFKGIDGINDVEKYVRCSLYVTKENRVELAENEYFIADLIGCLCIGDDGEALGEVTDVITTGANDVYVISAPEGREILVPAIKECILNVDVDKREILIHLLEGL